MVAEGPEIETPYYNFTALTLLKDTLCSRRSGHLLFSDDLLLRTNIFRSNSCNGKHEPSIRLIAPGSLKGRC